MFKVGDKVKIPKTKSYQSDISPLNACTVILAAKSRNLKFLIITRINYDSITLGLWKGHLASTFLSSDLELYEENNINMEKQVKLSLATAKEFYKQGGASKAFALDNYTEQELSKKELPKSWEELKIISGYYIDSNSVLSNHCKNILSIGNGNKNLFPTKELAEASLALSQLLQLREVYRDGWIPDYKNTKGKYGIYVIENILIVDITYGTAKIFSFQDREIANLFLTNFKDLLEIAKPLI